MTLIRVKVCLITIFAIIIGALVSGNVAFDIVNIVPVLSALIAGFVITGFGNVINDYYDYEIDKSSHLDDIKNRPVASGRVSMKEALVLSGIVALIGIIFAIFVSPAFLYLAVFNLFVSFIYARLLKPVALAKNISVAWLGASAFIGGSLIASPVIGVGVAVLASVAFLTTFSWEMLKDIRDVKNDSVNDIHTVPYYIGTKRTKIFSYLLLVLAFIVLIASYQSFNLIYLLGVIPAIVLSAYSVKMPVRKAYKLIRISTWFVILGLLASALV
tara:strand:- start:1060 stop:1875 length:816 start_codon:yes stop_codon:yes gene_type:complete